MISCTAGSCARLDQGVDGEVVRPDTVERRERAPEHMIARVDRVGALERPKVGDVGHHHDGGSIAPRVGADGAGILRVDVAANLAYLDLLHRGLQSGG